MATVALTDGGTATVDLVADIGTTDEAEKMAAGLLRAVKDLRNEQQGY